jgi:hypothetical protein
MIWSWPILAVVGLENWKRSTKFLVFSIQNLTKVVNFGISSEVGNFWPVWVTVEIAHGTVQVVLETMSAGS